MAVGMAKSIPPHNLCELADAALHLIKHPNASIDTLLQFVKGPDLPQCSMPHNALADLESFLSY